MLNIIRRRIDIFTSYKVVLFGLTGLVGYSLLLSLFGVLDYASTPTLAAMLGLLTIVCFGSNLLFGKLYKLPVNQESAVITAFILFFVLDAPSKAYGWLGLVFAGLAAIASKYIITSRGAAIFNPAAFGVFVASLAGIGFGAWWVAQEELLIATVIIGLIVLVKIRRFELFLAFFIPALSLIVARTVMSGTNISQALVMALALYPIVFLGTIMLTEPGTMPGMRNKRLAYGALVGLIFGSQFELGPISSSPEVALLAGNLFTLAVSRRNSVRLKFVSKKQLSPTSYDFAFAPERPIDFASGQYIELTLPGMTKDLRGNRRTFTIASIPDDKLIHFGIKFYKPGSWFKEKLSVMQPGEVILGNHVAGDFTLPHSRTNPVVFMAGGIGVTPFVSMLESILKSSSSPNASLYYFVSDKTEVLYKELLQRAEQAGVQVSVIIGRSAGFDTQELARHKPADFYVSGPPGFVDARKAQLSKLGINNIHTDYFSGY